MQFYILDPDPKTSARMLPDYALKSVNVREGWQILSDIGHRFGVEWEGQNKCYNAAHPLTRSFSNWPSFQTYVKQYRACCTEYLRRYKKSRAEIDRFCDGFDCLEPFWELTAAVPATPAKECAHYLLTRKGAKLSNSEFRRLASASGYDLDADSPEVAQ